MPSSLTPQKISKIVDASFDKFDHSRKARLRFLAQYVGRFYAKNRPDEVEDKKASPLNLIYQAVNTLVPNLVFRDPRFKVRTDILAYRGYADMLELGANTVAKKIKFRRNLRMAIVDSLFFAGFIKTGIATSGQFITMADQTIALGEPFADRVDPDDMIMDPMARDWEEQMFVGNRFRVLRQDLLDSGMYDNDLIASLQNREDYSRSGHASDISGQANQDAKDLMDFVDLAEIYIPRDKRVVTIPWVRGGQNASQFIRDVDYSGPDSGPFHMLGYAQIPDNLLPLPPVSLWYDLHILGNRMARKIARQSDRNKRVLVYDGSSVEDAKTIVEAEDGEAVHIQNVNGVKEVNYGGATEDAYGFMQWVETKFSDMANSLDMLSGQKADAPTATQSEMLQQNSSIRLADLQNQVYDFAAEVGTDIAFFLHTDPLIELPLVRRKNGVDEQVVYTPEERQGDFICYALNVQPMSMARPDPARKVQHLLQFAQGIIPAAAQAAQILGPAFRIGPYLERIALEIGLEEFDEIIDMPTFHGWMMAQVAAQINPGKAGPFATAPGGAMPMAQQPGFNQGQPNPGQMTASPQNIGPNTEQAQAAQQVAGELQKSYPAVSTGARASQY
jgi:hypothetical protein